jgi:hypothetical protein
MKFLLEFLFLKDWKILQSHHESRCKVFWDERLLSLGFWCASNGDDRIDVELVLWKIFLHSQTTDGKLVHESLRLCHGKNHQKVQI